MPFWSDRAYAAQCAKDEWSDYTPILIPLQDFTETWLPGMANDNVLVGVNWNTHLIGAEVNPLKLKEQLQKERKP